MRQADVVVVGGGPAGLSAALVLGRCRRRVVVVDAGEPRNAASRAVHGLLGQEGVDPGELRAAARAQLRPYAVELLRGCATRARRVEAGFAVELEDGREVRGRRLLLATGLRDRLPRVRGFAPLYGVSAHHCPYCDGWEHQDEPLVAWAQGPDAAAFALLLTSWSDDVLLCTDGAPVSREDRARLRRRGVAVRADRVARLEGRGGRLRSVVFARGDAVAREALFFHLGTEVASLLAEQLGCANSEDAGVHANDEEETTTAGVWVAGDASKDVLLVVAAAAEGARAAVEIHASLLEEELAGRPKRASARR